MRDHLARELHDAVTQSVYSASLIAQALTRHLGAAPRGGPCTVWRRLQRLVRSALAELRILLYELGPRRLTGVGLDQLLERLGDSLGGQAEVTMSVESAQHRERCRPQEVKEAMYRIAQEAFNNIAKHAQRDATCVAIAERSRPQRVRAEA